MFCVVHEICFLQTKSKYWIKDSLLVVNWLGFRVEEPVSNSIKRGSPQS